MATSRDFTELLALDLEAPMNEKDKGYGNTYSGYFRAPASGRYRFYMSCDDYCTLNFSNVSMSPSSGKT